MTHEEHVLTRTYGSKGIGTLQSDAGLSFRDVLAQDIRDVRNIVGTKYNEGLRSLTDYYRQTFPELMESERRTRMQPAIERLTQIGPLPSSSQATVSQLQEVEALLAKVEKPITDDEARALVRLFGPDDCFGLAWSLLHLVESSPSWPIEDALAGLSGEWIERLKDRAA